MRRLFLWLLPAGLGFLAATVLAWGAFAGLTGSLGTKPAPQTAAARADAPTRPPGALRVVALGDSLTFGTGDEEPAGGYAGRAVAELRKAQPDIAFTNLAVEGLTTPGLVDLLRSPETQRTIAGAGLLLVSISGNDLTRAARGDASPLAPGGPLLETRKNLEEILKTLRAANPHAPIRLLGLYDPLPAEAGPLPGTPERTATKRVLLLWNSALEEAALSAPGGATVVVPVADLFEARPERLAKDRFHPGPAGHAEIAARVVSSLPAALVTAKAP
ncbi:MAG: hypothetical protein JNK60_02005 [Acidobacteria bacterium]|nr:hypothetical protein [Acidobacteriota bacterium]